MTLFIVDDNQRIRQTIRSIVSVPADTVYEWSGGEEAVALFDQCRPDIVLMDIKMAEMDGIAATRAIRQKYPNARVMIVTEYDDPGLREEARRAGACEYVLKENLLQLGQLILKLR